MTEREFQQAVVQLARLMGWRVHHTRPALTQCGRWLTPIQGDAGFPDLVLCRPPRLILAELKRNGARPTPAQRAWLEALQACVGVECYLWTPADWKTVVRTLTEGGKCGDHSDLAQEDSGRPCSGRQRF